MTREEALSQSDKISSGENILLINQIFNNIGSCKECKHYAPKLGYCYSLQIDDFAPDFYCSNFERKK